MSEYQYYEFLAIDRPLTTAEMAALRACSSRADITPGSFVNVYNFGSFKGDENSWMERYFDAALYVSNWGTRILRLALPSGRLAPGDVQPYTFGDALQAREASGRIILTFALRQEEVFEEFDGENLLSGLVGLRAELAAGDLRALYLAWLLGVQAEDVYDDDDPTLEPPVPPGLGQLTASQRALVEFLEIDEDLLAVAAQGSAAEPARGPDEAALRRWLATVPTDERDRWLARAMLEPVAAAVSEPWRRYRESSHSPPTPEATGRRTAVELLDGADRLSRARQERAALAAAAEARRRAEVEEARRQRRLDALRGKEEQRWSRIDSLAAAGRPRDYDEALELLLELRDLATRDGDAGFAARVARLRQRYPRRPALLSRLDRAGL